MKRIIIFMALLFVGAGAISVSSAMSAASSCSSAEKSAAVKLLKRMKKLQKKGVMIGHQDDPVYGHNWKWDEGKSDIKDVVDDYPAVMGFELGGIELGDTANLDGVPFKRMREEIIQQYLRGGISELSWHPYNPVTGKNAWDPSGSPVREIIAGGSQYQKFAGWLGIVADFLASLKTPDGTSVPVIFRPWHEMGGSWFWWGSKSCTPDEYKQLFVYTHHYMSERQLSNLLWAYSPNGGSHGPDDFMKYYPGDQYVEMLGVDIYDFNGDNAAYQKNLERELILLQQLGKQHHKLIALTETGAQQLPDKDWFTKVFWPMAEKYPISYVLFWRNAWDNHKETYMTYPGAASEADFHSFYAIPRTLFVKDIKSHK